MKRVVLAGGSGLIATALLPALRDNGYEPVVLTRSPSHDYDVHWEPTIVGGPWIETLDGAYALINLVGRTVDCRKTPANKAEILNSRVDSVQALAAAVTQLRDPPKVWIQSATA